jgi:hypothetical protein
MEAPPPLNTYKNSLKISNKMGTRRMNGTRNFGKPTSEPKRTRSAFNYIGRRRNGQSIGYRQTPGQELERPFPSDKSTEPLADSSLHAVIDLCY